MKVWIKRFFLSWWMPSVATLIALAGFAGQQAFIRDANLSGVFLISVAFCLTLVLVSSFCQFAARRWIGVAVSGILFVALGFVCVQVAFLLLSFFGPADDFGKGAVFPPGMAYELPRERSSDTPHHDPEEEALLGASTAAQGPNGADLSVGLQVADNFVGKNRALLMRHLATSVKWFLTEQGGKPYARRRFVYDRTERPWSDARNYLQFRIAVRPDGPVSRWFWRNRTTKLTVGTSNAVIAIGKSFNGYHESNIEVRSKGPAFEIYEDATTPARRVTAIALKQLDAELNALWRSQTARTRGFDPALMPPESIKRGKAELFLVKGLQGGIYFIYAYLNPGEPGRVYAKAFEATQNTPLSPDRMAGRSTEYTGWSSDSEEKFFYNTQVTVYEGDWGNFYPARFELWFSPSSGGPERKLIEKTFKIEGWQR